VAGLPSFVIHGTLAILSDGKITMSTSKPSSASYGVSRPNKNQKPDLLYFFVYVPCLYGGHENMHLWAERSIVWQTRSISISSNKEWRCGISGGESILIFGQISEE
jgi:hypothetical protein